MKTFIIFLSIITISITAMAKVYTIGLLYNKHDSSPSTSNGIENHIKKGFDLALEELSGSDFKFKYEWLDVGETAETTLKLWDNLKKKHVDYLVGPSHSFQVELLAKLLTQSKRSVKIVSPAATSDTLLNYPDVFLMSNTNSVQANLIVKDAKLNSTSKVALINVTDCLYCTNLAGFIGKELSSNGIRYTEVSVLEAEQRDQSRFQGIKDYEHIFVPALESQIAEIISVLWPNNKNGKFWSCDGVGSLGRFVTQLPFNEQLNLTWVSHYHKEMPGLSNEVFRNKYLKKFKIDPIDTSAFYYESLMFTVKTLISGLEIDRFSTGTVRKVKNRLIRQMPLLELNHGKVKFKKMVSIDG